MPPGAVQLSGLTCLDTLVVGHRSALPEHEEAGRALGRLTFLEYERPELHGWMANLPSLQHLVRRNIVGLCFCLFASLRMANPAWHGTKVLVLRIVCLLRMANLAGLQTW